MEKTIKKGISRMKTLYRRFWMVASEKHYKLPYNKTLSYLFFRKRFHDCLIVVFSGMSEDRAKYNYVNTLVDVRADKVFILDDFGQDHLGCYYLCEHMDYYVQTGISELLRRITSRYHYKKVIFAGSSKGGWASLYYGLNYPKAAIIAGAPQYYLGRYLTSRKKPDLLYTIAGNPYREKDLAELDGLVFKQIESKKASFKGEIYIHYSPHEHTYTDHISFLLRDLKENGYSVHEDICDYARHDDVAVVFPDYLKQTAEMLIQRSSGDPVG